MNLAKEIKKFDDYEENYVEILKYIIFNKKSSQRMPNDEEFKKNFIENDVYSWKGKNKIYLLERLENYNNKEKVDVENLIVNNELTIEHIMPQTLNKPWKDSLGNNYEQVYNTYVHTIGNLTLTAYNSSLSNKVFLEKRDMGKGFKKSRLRLNKYLSEIDKWTEEEIKTRAGSLCELSLNILEYTNTNYIIKKVH